VYDRYINPVLTAEHTPLFWRYDFDHKSNPHLMERIGVNATFNAGAMEFEASFWCLRASRERIANRSLRWRKARTAWTTSASGIIRF